MDFHCLICLKHRWRYLNGIRREDNFLWIMVGDIPSMYLDVYGSKTTIEVLRRYNALAKDWIYSVERGLSVDECYPFDAEPTMEMADLLKRRVTIIENSIFQILMKLSYHLH
jgi:hypothetical protein